MFAALIRLETCQMFSGSVQDRVPPRPATPGEVSNAKDRSIPPVSGVPSRKQVTGLSTDLLEITVPTRQTNGTDLRPLCRHAGAKRFQSLPGRWRPCLQGFISKLRTATGSTNGLPGVVKHKYFGALNSAGTPPHADNLDLVRRITPTNTNDLPRVAFIHTYQHQERQFQAKHGTGHDRHEVINDCRPRGAAEQFRY